MRRILAARDGAIARRQALAAGLSAVDVARLIRRREWVAVHPGVYVDHTGPTTWRQRAWAAVLACWPAALDGATAIRAHEGPGRRAEGSPDIAIMVAHERHPKAPPGVAVRQSRRFEDQVLWNLSPPRMRYEDLVVDLADRANRTEAVLAAECDGWL